MNAVGRFEAAGRLMLQFVGGDKMSFLLGSQSALAHPLSLVLGIAAFGGLLLGSGSGEPHGSDRPGRCWPSGTCCHLWR